MRHLLLLLMFAFGAGGQAATSGPAGSVLASLRPAAGAGPLPCSDAVVSARRLGEPGGAEGPLRQVGAELGKPVSIPLEPGPWALSATAKGCWFQPSRVLVGNTKPEAADLRGWREAEVAGVLRPPRGNTLPENVRLVFSSSFANPKADEPKGELECPLTAEGRFRCPLPAAVLDLRLSAKGFAPIYWWEISPAAGKPLELGTAQLAAGSSLAGWLVTQEGEPPQPDEVTLALVPAGLVDAKSALEAIQRQFARHESKPLLNGFFQFDALKAGDYQLTVEGARFAETRLPVALVEGLESNLREPVLLLPPITIPFSITPASEIAGGAWRLVVKRLHESRGYADTVAEALVPLDGWYEAKGLSPGTHIVSVLSQAGDAVYRRELMVGEEPTPVLIEIGSVRVEGTLSLGREPLAATIWFGGQYGFEKVKAESDSAGRFAASLPRAGVWRVDFAAERPPVKKREHEVVVPEPSNGQAVPLDISLADTQVGGVVREPDGSPPRSRTLVYLNSGKPEISGSQTTDSKGRFEFHGIDEGPTRLYALRQGARSKEALVSLAASDSKEVNLVLEPTIEVKGLVVGPKGPVAGASIQLLPSQAPLFPGPKTATDAAGRFTDTLPAGTTVFDATVAALGATLSVERRALQPGKELVLEIPAEGGTLTLELPENQAGRDDDRWVVAFRNGVPLPTWEIEVWAQRHRKPDQGRQTMVLPNLAAGHYEVCYPAAEEYAVYMLGQKLRADCASGTLTALSELTLKLPRAKKK